MGSVGSATHASNPSQPQSTNSMISSVTKLLGSTSASDGIKCSTVSQSASSGSSASMVEYRDIDSRLAALEKKGIEFFKVEIYKSPLQITGIGNHHGLIYHYQHTLLSLVGGPSNQTMPVGDFALRVDWGQDGLSFCDLLTKHSEPVLKSKQCGLTPATLLEQITCVRDEEYNLLQWNCQHFSRHLFEQAGGNWHLSSQLNDLQNTDITIDAVTLYEKEADSSCVNDGSEIDCREHAPGLIYWYRDSVPDEATGIQIEWVPGGLGFRKIVDDGSQREGVGPLFTGTARNCGLKPAVVSLGSKSATTQGVVNAEYVSATPGVVKKACKCRHRPVDILEHLREVEGKAYQADEWNSDQFVSYMWERILVGGSISDLYVHLNELQSRGVVFNGLQEISVESPVFRRALVYSYVPCASSNNALHPSQPSQKIGRTVYLKMMFDAESLQFQETLNGKLNTTRAKIEIKKARKANIKVRLAPSELQQQLRELEEQSYDSKLPSSASDFCNKLFEKMPGGERVIELCDA